MAADVAEIVFYTEDAASPLTVSKPAGFGAGQMLIFVHGCDGGLLSALTGPAGWTQEENPVDISFQRAKVWTHVFDGTEPATWDFGYSGGDDTAAALIRITGADVTTPAIVVVSNSTASNGTTLDSPTVTPTGPDDLLICALTLFGNAALSETDPAGMTDLGQAQFGSQFQAIAVAKELLASSSPTGVRTWTSISPTARAAGAFSIAVKSAAAGGAAPPMPVYKAAFIVVAGKLRALRRIARGLVRDTSTLAATTWTVDQTDSAGLTDIAALAIEQTLTDTTGLTDTSTVQVVKDVTQTDSAGLTDSAEKTLSQAQTDSAGLTDTQAAQLTKTPTDSAGLTDTAAVELSKLLTQTDDAGLTDSVIRSIVQAVTDDTGLTDTTALSRSATQTDNAGLTDTTTVVSAKSVDQTDSAGLTDTFALRRDLVPTDSTGLTDTAAVALGKTQTDSAGLTDTATAGLIRDVTATDSTGLTDMWALTRALSITDSAGLTDSQAMARLVALADDAGLTDSATSVLGSPYTPAYVGVDGTTSATGALGGASSSGTTDGGTTTAGGLGGTAAASGALDGSSGPAGMVE